MRRRRTRCPERPPEKQPLTGTAALQAALPGEEIGRVGGCSGYVGCGDCGCGRAVCVGSLDVGSVRVGELLDLMVDLGEVRARLEGILMTVAGEVARRNGWEATAWMMREYNRVPAITTGAGHRTSTGMDSGLRRNDGGFAGMT